LSADQIVTSQPHIHTQSISLKKFIQATFSCYTTLLGHAVHIDACSGVDDDGHAVNTDETSLKDGAAVDSVRVAEVTVSIVENIMQLNYTYQETPPRTLSGAQPVAMGMFRLETSMPSRTLIRPLVSESTWLEFLTFWQHWAPPEEEPPVEPVGTAATAAARRTRGAKNCMFGIERRRWS
jgi:hypothetical protein